MPAARRQLRLVCRGMAARVTSTGNVGCRASPEPAAPLGTFRSHKLRAARERGGGPQQPPATWAWATQRRVAVGENGQ